MVRARINPSSVHCSMHYYSMHTVVYTHLLVSQVPDTLTTFEMMTINDIMSLTRSPDWRLMYRSESEF